MSYNSLGIERSHCEKVFWQPKVHGCSALIPVDLRFLTGSMSSPYPVLYRLPGINTLSMMSHQGPVLGSQVIGIEGATNARGPLRLLRPCGPFRIKTQSQCCIPRQALSWMLPQRRHRKWLARIRQERHYQSQSQVSSSFSLRKEGQDWFNLLDPIYQILGLTGIRLTCFRGSIRFFNLFSVSVSRTWVTWVHSAW